jgi:hypothetical protein
MKEKTVTGGCTFIHVGFYKTDIVDKQLQFRNEKLQGYLY